MATYNLTPQERRARAQALIQYRENRSLYNKYLREKEEADRLLREQQLNDERQAQILKDQNFLVKGLSTIGDVVANVLTGAIKGLEGIVDLGIGLVGAVGGIFDKGFQDDVKDIVAYDATGEWIGNPIQEALRYSYTKDGGIIEGVASGIGQMLPAVVVTIATGGAGAPAAVSQIASLATMATSAAGTATEEAFQEGANYYAGLGYGVASGAIEAATEKMFGGVTKGLTGAGVFDGITKSVADTGIKRIAKSALEEGVEEVVAELASPALKSIYKGSDAFSEYGEGEYWKNVGKAGIIGSMTALAYSGSVGYGLSKMGVGYVGKEADINDSLTEIDSLRQKRTNLQADDAIGENKSKIASTMLRNYQNIENTLKSVNETKRASLIKKFSLDKIFNADGTMNTEFSSLLDGTTFEAQASDQGMAAQQDIAYSAELWGQEQTIQSDLDKMSEDRAQAYLAEHTALGETLTIEQAREAVGKFAVLSTEMSEEAKTARRKFNKALNALNNISGLNTRFVVVDSNDTFNATVVNGFEKVGDRMYISADTFEDGSWAGALIHEYTHLEEGSKEYAEMYDFLQSDDILVEVETQEGTKKIPLWQKAQSAVLGKGYGFNQNQIKTISEKVQKGEELTVDERKIYNAFTTEVTAHETEYLLGNESFIDKIVAKDSSFAKRLIEKITHLKKAFEKSGEKKTRTELKQLQRAEKLYLNAARKAGDMRLVKFILAQNPELGEEEVDSNAEIRYNRRENDRLWGKLTKQEQAQLYTHIDELHHQSYSKKKLSNGHYLLDVEGKIVESDGQFQRPTILSVVELKGLGFETSIVRELIYDYINNGRTIYESVQIVNDISQKEVAVYHGQSDSAESRQGGEQRRDDSQNRRTSQNGNDGSGVSKKVRYSLKIGDQDVSGVVEEGNNLVALHNLSASNLLKVIELGGFPMPSIAITTTELPHENYGDITVIFGRDTIDPEADSRNVVYDRDAWTPTTPKVKVKLNGDAVDTLIEELQGKVGDYSSYRHDIDRFFDGKYRNNSGEYVVDEYDFSRESFGASAIRNAGIVAAYLSEKGIDVSPVFAERGFTMGWKSFTRQEAASLFEFVGITKDITRENATPKQREEILEKYIKYEAKKRGFFLKKHKPNITEEEIAERIRGDYDDGSVSQLFFMAEEFFNEHREKDIYDDYATLDKMKSQISDEQDFYSWLWEKVEATFDKKGIDNDSDIFDSRGNRKSFESRHYSYTLGNIVKAMLKGDQEGKVPLGMTAGALAAKLSKRFDSIDDIRDARKYLALVSEEEEQAFKDRTYQLYDEIVTRIVGDSGDFMSNQTRRDDVGDILGKCASVKPLTIANIKRKFDSETRGYNLNYKFNDEIADMALSFFETLRHIPTTYFEAKPRRAVRLNEIKNVLLPNGVEESLVKALEKKKIPYTMYDAETEGSRSEIIRGMDGIRFSLKDSEGRTLTEAQRKFFAESQIRDGKGNLIPVYHGSDFDFNIFDKNKINTGSGNQWGEGFYFTFYGEVAGDYGDNIKEFYLNIKNPFEVLSEGAYRQVVDLFVKYGYEVDSEMVSKKYDNLVEGIEEDYDLIDILYSVVKTKRPMHEFTEIIKKEGYDGIIAGGEVIAFDTNQIKLTTNESPTLNEDIRYSLIDDPTAKPYFYELTDGQVKKLLANSTKMKVYSKVESEGIINDILGNYMSFGDSYGTLSGKAKSEVIDMLWRGLNTAEPGRQAKVALDVAEYIIQHSVVESMYDDPTLDVYMDTIALLKPYLHSIDLSHLKGEIKHRYDKDNSVYLLWGKRKGEKGFGADQIALELEELGFHIDAINEADIFFQIDEAYRSAVAHLKKEAKSFLSSALSTEERKELKQALARQILLAFDKNGKPSKLAGILEEYAKKSKVWREKYYEERSKNKVLNRVLDKIQKIKDIKLGTFLNSSQFKNDIFKGSIERLANIKYRGNLNEAGTRNILEGLAEWYVKENPMLQGVFDEDIASMLQTLAKGEGKLTVDELKALENVVDYFKHFIENYNKVYRNGKYVDALPIAEKYVGIVRKNKPAKVGWLCKWFEKYTKTFADPMTLARYMDRYDEGFFTEMLENLRRGAVDASVMEMEMREPLEEFYKKNKKFLKDMTTKTIEYQGKQIPLAQAMLLYMSLNRDQAILGLARSGFTYNDGKETIRVEGFALEEELTIEEVRVRAKEVQSSLASQFTEVEKEYISIAEKLFNETAKEAKRKTDILRRGYSNALEDYYVPIRRANVSQNADTSTFSDEMNRVSNASFNRDTVRGAKNELFIEALDVVLGRHIKGVALYANLALAIDEYNLLYNLDIGGNPNQSVSVRTENETGIANWSEADAYFKKLISDIQGIPVVKGEGSRFMGWLRGGYAKYQLGANPKVWVTQLSSFAAAGSILDVSSIVKGVGVKASDVDKYCSLAKVRNSENAAALAQGVIEKTGKVGDVLMKPIGMVDRFVVMRLFGACQVQVEKNQGLKVGTEENKVEAGKLLERVILETQQNSMATERSSAMRSGSELMKTITMFSADSMKVIGRVVDSIGEVAVLKAKRKAATDATEIAELDKKIKEANKKARKSVGSLVSSAIFMALIAQAFRWLYAKDDEDENIVHNMGVDAVGNLLGGLPLIRDIYSRFAEGYDFDNYAYSAINDMFDSAESLFTTAGNIVQGDMDSREVASTIKNLLYAAGQIFGIPTRNVYNIAAGLTKRISPSTGYKLDDMFYKQSYRSDLAKAIEKGDEKMIATITGLMLDENIGGIDDSEARKAIDELIQAGHDVIPRAVSDKITYDGVEYALTPGQVKEFEKVYLVANEALASLVKLPQFKDATDEVKAKAINFIYNVYYNLALQDFLGVDLETKSVLFAEAIDIEKLAIVVATANSLTADLDKKGKVIAGTRKAKVQSYVNSLQLKAVEKYMIMGYLGYTNTKGEAQVKAYINRLKLTKTEKKKLLEYSGY